MNKWLLLTAGSVMMMNAQAESLCGYKDYFHISNQTHPAINIINGYSDQDLVLQFVGPRSFIIRDSYQCRTGYAHVNAAYDAEHWCTLDIKDGPLMNHPTVNASCSGMNYLGMSYDGFGSYAYTLNFE